MRRLLAGQFPEWSELPIEELPIGGTDNAIYRLGDELSVRLPIKPTNPGEQDLEFRWLPVLAPRLPVAIPEPLALGQPAEGYPNEWAIHRWLPGIDATVAPLDLEQAAIDLADLIAALWRIDPAGGPGGGRGEPLAPRDEQTRSCIAELGLEAALPVWEAAVAAPVYDGPRRWLHGDLDNRNLLLEDRRITGILDWSCACVGDPACDVKVAWAVLDAETRPVFRERLGVDDATWARARGWAVSQAVVALPYYRGTYPAIVREAERWLSQALWDGERPAAL
ncbi:MAG TPA: aminoglycoside phosphotransferase family protein [Gaiellaceae bacterium]|nr:aminoglycoside phosphotransferase family protein [Gaiellaceae bacterium]